MPIYEYVCNLCQSSSSFLLLRISEPVEPYCKCCGSKNVERVLSPVVVMKNADQRVESVLDPSNLSSIDETDPRSVERFVKKMGDAMGDEMGGDFREAMKEAINDSPGPGESVP